MIQNCTNWPRTLAGYCKRIERAEKPDTFSTARKRRKPHEAMSGLWRGSLERATKKVTFGYKGTVFAYDQPGAWCQECGEAFLESSDKEATALLLADFQARVDGRLTTSHGAGSEE